RIAVRAAPAGQCHRKLHEGHPTRAGEDRARGRHADADAAIRSVRGRVRADAAVGGDRLGIVMASASTAGPVSLSDRLRGFAATLPADLPHSPVLGIVGVIMGAGIVTLAGRLLTLGLADLKGNVGIGFDEGAWIPTAFNVALMFIGPLTVYLGATL